PTLAHSPPPFPYTTLFRSLRDVRDVNCLLHGARGIAQTAESAEGGQHCRRESDRQCRSTSTPTAPLHANLIGARHQERRRRPWRSEEHTSELQSPDHLVCR